MPDWATIKAEYEAGDSQRILAARHNVPQTTIASRAKKEQWKHYAPFRSPHEMNEPMNDNGELPSEPADIARYALGKLALLLKGATLDLKEHKLLSDALSQYTKVLIATNGEEQSQPSPARGMQLDLADLTNEELDQVIKISKEIEMRKAAQDEKIVPIRRAN